MSRYKGVIFDLDGVIVDTAKYHFLAWEKLARELGFCFTKGQNERLKGVSRARSLDILLEIGKLELDDKTKLGLATKKNNWYVEYISKLTESEILPGAVELIEKLRKMKIKIALGSASKNAPLILKRINLFNCFDVICDGNSIKRAKPDPEIFIVAAKKLRLKPSECIVIEDSLAGIKAAKSADMFAIGVGNSDVLKEADIIVGNLANIDLQFQW